jgi:hypothetical protein
MDTAVKIIFDKITMNKNHSYRIITTNFMGVLCLTEQARQACFTIENRQL